MLESIPREERAVIRTDFNGHVGEGNRGDGQVWGQGKDGCDEYLIPKQVKTQGDIREEAAIHSWTTFCGKNAM